jgi:hypothetical protein
MHLGQKPFVCEQCGKAYLLKTQLNKHMERHTGKPQCASCGLFSMSSATLAQHMKRIHTERVPLKCPNCEMHLVNKFTLLRHIERNHKTLEERCFCTPCNETFSTVLLRKIHEDPQQRENISLRKVSENIPSRQNNLLHSHEVTQWREALCLWEMWEGLCQKIKSCWSL